MKILIVTIGTKMSTWVQQGCGEYLKRFPKGFLPKLVELPLASRQKNYNVKNVKSLEGKKILSASPSSNYVIALDVLGKTMSTEELASKMSTWKMEGTDVSFIIGGPDGLSNDCLQSANEKWSLSRLTMPHPLVRIILIEQLYRAWTILQNHPYHK